MTSPLSIGRVGVVAAGFMGSGIAEAAAKAGIEVTLHEPEPAAVDRSRSRIEESLQQAESAGKLWRSEVDDVSQRIVWTPHMDELRTRSIVVEAVCEDADVKAALFTTFDELLPPATILGLQHIVESDRTTRLMDTPSRPCSRPPFLLPVPVMKLAEVVVGLDTAPEIVERAERFAAIIGKTAIRTKDRSAFIVNMLLVPYLMAAVPMVEDGFASREDIDQGMKLGAGHPMGPLTLCDLHRPSTFSTPYATRCTKSSNAPNMHHPHS